MSKKKVNRWIILIVFQIDCFNLFLCVPMLSLGWNKQLSYNICNLYKNLYNVCNIKIEKPFKLRHTIHCTTKRHFIK